jgi:ADP-ribose pyrophosphatase YjhB (NUDIX family)
VVIRKSLFRTYVFADRIARRLVLPALRIYLRRTTRSYVLLRRGDEFLLLMNWLGDGKWALPGGGLKGGETPKQAVIRELEEELAIELKPKDLNFITKGRWATDRLGHYYYIYLATMSSDKFKIDGKEIVLAKWLDFKNLSLDNTPKEVLNSLNKALK